MMKSLRIPLFSTAMSDEVLLSKKAKALLSSYPLPLMPKDILYISQRYGVDLATRCYYEYLLQSRHGEFKQLIDDCIPTDDISKMGQDIKLLIIPGMFYKEHPEVGADGQLVISIARQCGFSAELVETISKGSIVENVAIIKHRIAQEQAAKIWLVSMSKGGSEVRHYLQSCDVPATVKGWLNIAGVNQGSPHAARKLSNISKKLFYVILCKLMNVNYQVLTELHPEHHIWENTTWHKEIDCVH
ncbi:MAG: hypothetical protein OQL19_19210, partial [Gammaproteobacteria bacterium]|nr:hypothetical protein [Gammaproteobacteria bacterium]